MDSHHNIIVVGNKTYDLAGMSEEEKWQLEHQRLHEKHRGHERMHLEMFLILIVCLVLAQVGLFQWRQRHFSSYQRATLFGMWIIPPLVCFQYGWWTFLIVWSIFSIVTGSMTWKASSRHVSMNTPRHVYTYFLLVYKLSYGLGILGYVVIMGTLFGLNTLFGVKPNTGMDAGLVILYYGLYFGVVSRDLAEVCADKMAAHIGYYTPDGVPVRHLNEGVCAVCNNQVVEGGPEKTYRLGCSHVFHEFCIRGWCIVGKKQTCPYCKEKVDLKRMFKNPWEKPHMMYGSLLDWVRYLVAWQPVIIVLVQGVNWVLGLE